LAGRRLAEFFPHHSGHGVGLGHPEPPYLVPESSETLEVGDVVVLYSDGVTESCPAEVDEEFGEQRLAAALSELRGNSAKAIIEGVNQRLQAFVAGAPAADDITLVVAGRVA